MLNDRHWKQPENSRKRCRVGPGQSAGDTAGEQPKHPNNSCFSCLSGCFGAVSPAFRPRTTRHLFRLFSGWFQCRSFHPHWAIGTFLAKPLFAKPPFGFPRHGLSLSSANFDLVVALLSGSLGSQNFPRPKNPRKALKNYNLAHLRLLLKLTEKLQKIC